LGVAFEVILVCFEHVLVPGPRHFEINDIAIRLLQASPIKLQHAAPHLLRTTKQYSQHSI
jgi:hypothetical protein